MRKSGINSQTPNDFLLGAGVVFKNFKYEYSKVEDAKDGALEWWQTKPRKQTKRSS